MTPPSLAPLLFPILFGFAQAGADEPRRAPEVTRAELERHVRFLAADERGGRLPMTSGAEEVKQYLAGELASYGLEPAGDEGSFFQALAHVRLEVRELPRLLLFDESGAVRELRHGEEFALKLRGRARATEKLPLRVFYDYNHARMPLAGNPAEALYFSGPGSEKRRILMEKGIASLQDWGLEIEVRKSVGADELGKLGEPITREFDPNEPEGCELVELRGPILPDFERRKFTHIQLLLEEVQTPFVDANVVGRLRGAGRPERPELAQEVVVLSAHYDHLGIRARPRGPEHADAIRNGADDNASGCATLLELAQAFALGPQPARTLVVLFTTSEETGGQGTKRYLAAPPEPLARTVANLNFDMLGRPDEEIGGAGRLWLTSHERTNLGPAWAALGLPIVADPRPMVSLCTRPDHFAATPESIVAQTLSSFGDHAEGHTPRDEIETLDFAHLESAARVAHQAARTLVDGSLAPAWLEGQRPQPPKPPRRGRSPEAGQGEGREKDD